MRRTYKTQSITAEINITPFTDVILVLLIIFMIATPLISQSNIEVKLPEASSKTASADSKSVYITVTDEGLVYIENQMLTNKELKGRVHVLLEKDRDLKVVLAADQSCRFQEVVRVIDALQEAGVKSLNIATKINEY
ncbi:MAG TPA: hypothetical protein DD723_05960 [Candidatus Omnitrophica bacterium]|nr:MAG: hypothetical protein A2Z81_06815 [Omnitrophica WOR_2 bacterium GWA2_45_18]OGX19552.1 MAG: hypothetical protein A2Y04_06460 [Omnitrophica WOR_2 bacterium GWC2_45_7]HBR15070.1 hypothetical protein [Candidatus Omnitrophota bacterium]